MNRLRLTLALLAAAALRCGSAPPAPGSFYTPPQGRPLARPGDLIRSEPMKGAPPGASAWKVLYVSTGLEGEPIAVSGVIIAPDLPPPASGRPVVAWAHPTTGVDDACAPSNSGGIFDTIPHLPALIALDYVVTATDYPGLGTPGPHPYLVGESEGRSVLDSVRAARKLEKAGAGPRFAAWGHSQGGQAVLFAGQLARAYAPELSLAGVAAIAPATELAQLLKDDLDERAGRILTAYSLWSWSHVYGASLEGVVTPSLVDALDRVARDCIETVGEEYRVGFASFDLREGFVSPDAFTREPWTRLLAQNRPGAEPIGSAIYIAQGTEDPIVRPSVTADFVRKLCGRNEVVQFDELPGIGHLRAGHASATSAIQWMQARFEARAAPNTCPPR